MSKMGVNINIELDKIDKQRIVTASNGKKYLNLQVFMDPNNPGKYGDHGFITMSKTKDEPKDLRTPIVGNVKVFWREDGQAEPRSVPGVDEPSYPAEPAGYDGDTDFASDIPF